MNKGNIKRKLASRKLWLALALFVSGLITAFGGSNEVASTVAGCIMQGAAVVAYILMEGWVDANGKASAVQNSGYTGPQQNEMQDGIDAESLTDDQLRELLLQMGLSRTYTDGLSRSQLMSALENLAE